MATFGVEEFSATIQAQGPAGPPGPQGPAGPAGSTGPQGPAGPPGVSSQTPWASAIDAAGFALTNTAQIGVNTTTPAYTVDITGDLNVSGHFYRAGVEKFVQNQNVVTSSRAAEAVYQNTSGELMYVNTSWNMPGKTATLTFYSDLSNPPTTMVAQMTDTTAQGNTLQLFCIVLPGYYYQCHAAASGPVLVCWVEYS